jgi:hypothetical protein
MTEALDIERLKTDAIYRRERLAMIRGTQQQLTSSQQWDAWLKAHIDANNENLIEALMEAITVKMENEVGDFVRQVEADLRADFDRKLEAMRTELSKRGWFR